MNLIKSFNKAYLKENIKKSRGLILGLNKEYYTTVVEKPEVMWVNLIGMYVIPFILSFSLFGYVYKKASVDFINSMPLNRKTIFVTNTIGGILLIALMQAITAIILFICNMFCSNIIIFPGMIIDICTLMIISYTFVFLATNLAMAVSGTFLTQVAITLLILFLVPFCIDSIHGFDFNSTYTFIDNSNIFEEYVEEKQLSYTMPYNMFNMLVTGRLYKDDIYSVHSILRMAIIGILYFLLGLKLFNKRKMEDTEESFSNVKLHLIVKALTILPMIIFINLIDPEVEFTIFAFALITVYYFVFDFVVKRKVSLKLSIGSLLATVLIFQGICSGVKFLKEEFTEKSINKENIVAVSIDSYRYNYNYSYTQTVWEEKNYSKNQEIIDLIFEAGYKATFEKEKNNNHNKLGVLNVYFKTKTGKEINVRMDILQNDIEKILEVAQKDEKIVEKIRDSFYGKGEILLGGLICDENEKKQIFEEIEKNINNISTKDLFKLLEENNNIIKKYSYRNNKLKEISLPIDFTEEIFKIATDKMNRYTKESIEMARKEGSYYGSFYIESLENTSIQYKDYEHYINDDDKIIQFILKNYDEPVEYNKPYYILKGNALSYRNGVYFFTNKVEEIDFLLQNNMLYEDALKLYNIEAYK